MSHFQKILVPMDGSPASIAALDKAVMLAEDLGASVAVLHVTGTGESDRAMDAALAAATGRLAELLTQRTESGDPLKTILDVAGQERPDLIVIGTHGRVGRLHALVGSVAESIVRNAPCPVVTVRHGEGEEESFAERIHHRPGVARPSH